MFYRDVKGFFDHFSKSHYIKCLDFQTKSNFIRFECILFGEPINFQIRRIKNQMVVSNVTEKSKIRQAYVQ